MGTNCTSKFHRFPSIKKRLVEAGFSGGSVTSDGGLLLLSQVDHQLGLTESIGGCIEDSRQAGKVTHSVVSMIRQRVFGIALGNEDLNDHETLRHDVAWQTAVGEVEPLSSAATLCRFENSASRELAWKLHRVLMDCFIRSHKTPPKELILDFDATDDPVHGDQEGKFFHGYYGHYCFLPLYVTCNGWVLVSYLRRSNIDAAKHAGAILKLLVGELRRAWPGVRIIIRADSGFCRHRVLSWSERNGIKYVIGIARNNRLQAFSAGLMQQAEQRYCDSGQKQRLFGEFRYAADTWSRKRRVIAKAEYNSHGENPRYIVTNLTTAPQQLYDTVYCARGEMENRIKEQLEMFSDRTSCRRWWANQLRLLFSTFAYTLVHALRTIALCATEFARAQVGTIRLKLLKIGAVVVRNTRRVRFLLSSAHPHQRTFLLAASRLTTG